MVKKILKYYDQHIGKFIIALLCMVVIAILEGLVRFLIKPLLDTVFNAKDITMLYKIVIAIPLVYLFLGIFNYVKNFLMTYIAQNIILKIRNQAYEHLHYLSAGFYAKGSTGKIMSRLTNDVMALQLALTRTPAIVVGETLKIIVFIGLIFYFHWKFALISLVAFPLASGLLVTFSRKMRYLSHSSQKQMGELYTNLQESISAINITKAFNREMLEIERFSKSNKKFFQFMIRLARWEALSSPVMQTMGALALALVLYFAGKDVLAGVWTAGSFFAFFAVAFSVYQPLRSFAQLNPQVQAALSASGRIFELIDEKSEIIEKSDAYPLPKFEKEIKFENVSFSYNKTTKVLNNLSFKINSGEAVAIVGHSGSGKTTIAHLLLRFYDATNGKIYIDKNDICNVTLKSLRAQIGIVTQDTILFNETIKYNIAYGKVDATEKEIIDAAVAAQAHNFISKTPNGYNTIVGERGVLLSGGEKQRIAIARAIIRNPRILVLDEATSALDAESEKLVQEALEKLMEGRTTLLIAHRLATVKKANRIIVIDNGEIVDIGTHEELFKKEGVYRRLHQLQLI